ncbi:MAG TPA: F0F1 ATP synthase subunit delta [Xanthomonadales bacterium]
MSNATTLARPYAKAAFELALAENATGRWNDMLDMASTAVTEKSLAGLLESPHASSSQIVKILTDMAGEAFSARFNDFLAVLAENKRLSLLPEIATQYQGLREEADKLLRVRVVSAFALDEDQATRLKSALAKRFNREILLEAEVDRGVIGGAVIYAGGQVIDGSLRDRLAKLSNRLSN